MNQKERIESLEREVKLLRELVDMHARLSCPHYTAPCPMLLVTPYTAPYTAPYNTGTPLPVNPITICNS